MEIKTIQPINFLFLRAEIKVSELVNYIPVARELVKEASQLDLHISGPVHWHYFGFTGDDSKPFTLEVALPIGKLPENYSGKFLLKRTTPFRCVTHLHEGGWLEIPNSYSLLMQFISGNKIIPTGENRELYINADFENPDANTTLIQMGVS